MPTPAAERVRAAAHRLGQHPQDHGWRELYRLLAHGLSDHQAPHLTDLVAEATARHPESSDIHLVTLLGIAIRSSSGTITTLLDPQLPIQDRLAALEDLVAQHRARIGDLIAHRQNSFTAARRFLVPQILLAAYFSRQPQPARFADLGTGLGILPRQLNCKTLFERFIDDLTWPGGRPAYQPIPLAARFGVDRGPLPDLAWVHACYGPSAYYTAEYHELLESLALPEVRRAEVQYHELDLTDPAALRRFIREYEVNAVNLCYTLYEIEPGQRATVLDVLSSALAPPGLIVVIEPRDDLTKPGCLVTVRDQADPSPSPVCAVSDGHFRGQVTPLANYQKFIMDYPIRMGGVDAASRDHATG